MKGCRVQDSTQGCGDDVTWATRLAEGGDLETVAALLSATNRHYWGAQAGGEPAARNAAASLLSGASSCRMLLGFRNGRAVAYITFAVLFPSPNMGGAFFMKDLFVIDGERGTGVGEKMMSAAAGLALDWGCCRFDWTAETSNPRALAFYDRLSARRVTEKVYFRVTGADLERLAGEVGPR